MASVLERMVQPHWENRYQNVPELQKDLEAPLSGSPLPRAQKTFPLNRYVISAIASTLALGAFFAYRSMNRLPEPEPEKAPTLASNETTIAAEDKSVRFVNGSEGRPSILEVVSTQVDPKRSLYYKRPILQLVNRFRNWRARHVTLGGCPAGC